MTLPTSGALSLNDIKGEFGGPTSPSLGDYYAGGSYVPAGTTGTNGAVPSSGTISISNFYGTSAVILVTSIVAGYEVYSSKINTTEYYGYSDGDPTFFPPPFGSIGVSTFNGATIKGIWWQSSTSGPSTTMNVCLSGNRDLSFFDLLVANGTTYNFAGTTPFYNSTANYTVFEVDDPTNPFPSSGTTYSCTLS
jgi:hypothetical protein